MSRKNKSMQALDRHIGQKIKWYRIQRGLSQEALATSLGISYQQLHKYENGSNSASASRLSDIAHNLGVTVGDFFNGYGIVSSESWLHERANREQLLLVKYFNQIEDTDARQAVTSLIKTLSEKVGMEA